MKESEHFDDYMGAYQDMLRATSKPWAPWYSIPADSKSYMRRTVAQIIVDTMEQLPIAYPKVPEEKKEVLEEAREVLEAEKAEV